MDKEFIKEYFGQHWTSRTSTYTYSNHSIAEKIQPGEQVIDVGCGNNEFKALIPGLIGIDIVNPAADIVIDFDEYQPDQQFDVALSLGAIQYGDESDIRRQLDKLSSILKPVSRIYWRTNTGVRDHKNDLVNQVPYYPWSISEHHRLAQAYGFTVDFIAEDLYGRLYAEWSRK
jgi:cyclopropane fatty-acyl-phospholipid synthase-like methyltransferase